MIADATKESQFEILTNDISQVQVVTLAVFLEGGDQKSVDTEDVAVRANKLAPGRFSWRKYPDQINLEIVRVYLSDAKSPEKGGLIVGSGRTGWSLTPAGLKWAREASKRLHGLDLSRSRDEAAGGSVDERRWRRERTRLLATRAWKRWAADRVAPVDAKDAAEVFRIDSYAEGRMRTMKITRLRSLFAEDAELLPFIDAMAQVLNSEG